MFEKLPPNILVIEFNEIKKNFISNIIERYWFNVFKCATQVNAFKLIELHKIHIIIVSVDLATSSEVTFIQNLRKVSTFSLMPVIFIFEKDENDENFYSEYIAQKPELTEVLFRSEISTTLMPSIKRLLYNSKPTFQDKILQYKNIVIDLGTYQAFRNKVKLHLGPIEFKILQLLVQSPTVIFTRQQIINYVWEGEPKVDIRTVDVHVNRLRGAIKLENEKEDLIKTIRYVGYCLISPDSV